MKVKFMAITIVLALVLSLVLALAGPVAAFAPAAWNVSGTWHINVLYNSVTYPETLSLTQSGSTISGVYLDTIPPGSLFTINTGYVSGNHVVIDGVQGGLTVELVGDIANDGSMGGTWSDIIGGSRTGTWQSTSGYATQTTNPGDTQITGYVTAPSIGITAPSPALDFGQFTFGVEKQVGPSPGSVGVVLGSATNVNWTVTATDATYGNGYMWHSYFDYHMATILQICVNGSTWLNSNVGATVSGTNDAPFNFYAKQTAVTTDPATIYVDTVVFSVAITSFN